MTECNCAMYQRNGICWHTGYKPIQQESRPKLVQLVAKPKPAPRPIRSSRARPLAIERMFDFLDLCEKEKPGSSGLDGKWHV